MSLLQVLVSRVGESVLKFSPKIFFLLHLRSPTFKKGLEINFSRRISDYILNQPPLKENNIKALFRECVGILIVSSIPGPGSRYSYYSLNRELAITE